MSKYTTEVRFICETYAGLDDSVGYNDVETVIAKALPKIFNFNFPIYDESYRTVLETKIIRHYYTREIAFETAGLWQLKLSTKLNEIMPYYNKLYNSELYNFNPLYDVDLTKDRTGNRETNSTGSSTGHADFSDTTTVDNENWQYYQDTPQGGLTNVNNLSYLTNATKNTDDNTTEREGENDSRTTTTEKVTDEDSYIEHIIGSNGGQSFSAKIMEFRQSLLNIDLMIIDELKDLFFLLW